MTIMAAKGPPAAGLTSYAFTGTSSPGRVIEAMTRSSAGAIGTLLEVGDSAGDDIAGDDTAGDDAGAVARQAVKDINSTAIIQARNSLLKAVLR
jgi:hypothetical protein